MRKSVRAARVIVAAALCLTSPMLVQAQDGSEKNLCWRKSFGRGAGTIPTDCPAGQVKENGLCYSACGAGFAGNGPLCWQSCPAGFSDIGVSCTKPAAKSSAGYPWKFGDKAFDFDTGPRSRCEADNGKDNCYRSGDIWYPKCPANFHKVGDLVCSPDCPAGMRDDGGFCAKETKVRGVGQIPNCGSGLTNDAGLCYPSCPRDFDGAGPACWGKCPADMPFSCGAGCAKSQTACAAAVTDMALQTVSVVVNVATTALGAPGVTEAAETALKSSISSASKLATQGAFKSAESMIIGSTKGLTKEYAWTFVKTMAKNQLDPRNAFSRAYSLGKFATLTGLNAAANESATVKESGQLDYTNFMIADPTGISSMVYAFAKYGSCSVDDSRPVWKASILAPGQRLPAASTLSR